MLRNFCYLKYYSIEELLVVCLISKRIKSYRDDGKDYWRIWKIYWYCNLKLRDLKIILELFLREEFYGIFFYRYYVFGLFVIYIIYIVYF